MSPALNFMCSDMGPIGPNETRQVVQVPMLMHKRCFARLVHKKNMSFLYKQKKWSQYKRLKKIYKIIMWDVLSGDFSSVLSAGECLDKSLKASEPGSIIVFHDSIKSIAKLKQVLPKYLDSFASAGFTFKAL